MLFLVNWASNADVEAINDDHADIEDLATPSGLLVEAPTLANALAWGQQQAFNDWNEMESEDLFLSWTPMDDGTGAIARQDDEEYGWVLIREITIHKPWEITEDMTEETPE